MGYSKNKLYQAVSTYEAARADPPVVRVDLNISMVGGIWGLKRHFHSMGHSGWEYYTVILVMEKA